MREVRREWIEKGSRERTDKGSRERVEKGSRERIEIDRKGKETNGSSDDYLKRKRKITICLC